MKLHHFRIVSQQSIRQQSFLEASQIFDRFGGLNGADGSRHRAEDARLLATQYLFERWRLFEQAAVTSALLRNHRHRLPLQTDDSRVGKGDAQGDGCVVDEKLGGKIIAAINDKIVTGKNFAGIAVFKAQRIRAYLDVGIQLVQLRLGRFNFGVSNVRRRVQQLALEIR